MIRVYVICEGQTERTFIQEVVASHFETRQILLQPTLIGSPGHKGGNVKFDRLSENVKKLLASKDAYCTTFFDFYGLPENFPGKSAARTQTDIAARSDSLLQTLTGRLRRKLGAGPLRRFIPYVQMYEFEALLFSDPGRFATGIDQPGYEPAFQAIRDQFPTPEHINDSPNTAPSKRITRIDRSYEKETIGTLAALEIGLDTIRRECHLFHHWLIRLEALAP